MGLIDRWKRAAASTMSSAGGSSATSSMPDTSPSSERAPSWMTDRMRLTVMDGRDDLEVVGESFYQPNLWQIVGGHTGSRVRSEIVAILVAEHNNRYDAKAVSVWINGLKVGHLSREDAARIRPGLISLQRKYARPVGLVGVITGGGADDGRRGNLGVFLDFDEADFGLAAPAEPTRVGVRTGLSEALTTDVADDGYDLGWFHSLPDDASKRLIRLRKLLLSEESPLSRHYIFAELEALLYKFRDAFPSAKPEYDEVCRKHDTEMDAILPALVAKFGVVPLLDTYRQAAIRHHKAKDYQQAVWWAERGIALYSGNPANEDMLADLRRRAEIYRRKLAG